MVSQARLDLCDWTLGWKSMHGSPTEGQSADTHIAYMYSHSHTNTPREFNKHFLARTDSQTCTLFLDEFYYCGY